MTMMMTMMMMKARQAEDASLLKAIATAFNREAFEPLLSSSYRHLCNVSLRVTGAVSVAITCISHLEGYQSSPR